MKKLLLVALLLLLLPAVPALALDADKQLHLTAGALLATGVDTVLYHTAPELGPGERVWWAVLIGGFGAGLGKESFDLLAGGTVEGKDVLYTIAGAAIAAPISELTNGLLFVSAYDRQVVVGFRTEW